MSQGGRRKGGFSQDMRDGRAKAPPLAGMLGRVFAARVLPLRWPRPSPGAALPLVGGAIFALGALAAVAPLDGDTAPRLIAGTAPQIAPARPLSAEAAISPDTTLSEATGAAETPVTVSTPQISAADNGTPGLDGLGDRHAAFDAEDLFDTPRALPPETGPLRRAIEVEVESGDTLGGILAGLDIPAAEAQAAVKALGEHFKARDLRIGQRLEIEIARPSVQVAALGDDIQTPPAQLVSLSLRPDRERVVRVLRDAERSEQLGFAAQEIFRDLTMRTVRAEGTIEGSLFGSATRLGVPDAIMMAFTKLYSYSVDFQREIQRGDHFEIYYTEYMDEDGVRVKTGDILYASLETGRKPLSLWRFEIPGEGIVDYFDETGQSSKKFLMRTPIDGARISSNFGKRRHPILGYTKLHTGTDFAAPTGTPIYAAGNGVIEQAGWNGGYGKYVLIRHANGYKTAYAHMSRIARGLAPGTRVSQGQTIGYVGSTGRSTGPHLHYEVHIQDKKVNPMTIRVPTGRKLAGLELDAFQQARSGMTAEMAQVAPLKPVTTASAGEADTGTSVE